MRCRSLRPIPRGVAARALPPPGRWRAGASPSPVWPEGVPFERQGTKTGPSDRGQVLRTLEQDGDIARLIGVALGRPCRGQFCHIPSPCTDLLADEQA